MTLEISQTMLYVAASVLLLVLIMAIFFMARKSHANKNSTSPYQQSATNKKEAKRRKEAARQIEAKINANLKEQETIFKAYISNLEYSIKKVNKKIFFNVTQYTQTDPSNLFNILRSAFRLSSADTVYYCRRNSSTFGADDYFIITKDGFHFGDSNGENGEGLMFEYISKVEDSVFDGIDFFNNSNELLAGLNWDYVLYNGDIEEKVDFIEITNKFLKKYKTEEDILIDAALEAADAKAIPLLSRLTERLGADSVMKHFVRAAYYYVLAEDGINIDHNIGLCNYAIEDIENEVKKVSTDYKEDVRSYYLFGMCEILKCKIALLSNVDSYDIEQSLKELMGPAYLQEVREEASRMLLKINRKN